MYIKSQTRADSRGLVGAVLVGSITGLALGGVYLAGGLAQTASQHARVSRLADGASEGFSDAALVKAASRMDPGALAVARRHDPYTVAGAAQRDRQISLLVARLENRNSAATGFRSSPLMLRASFGGPFNPSPAPFRLTNVLESSRELDCLADAVYYEARGETPSGQAAVAQVVLNRVRHPAFPKSICGVVFQGAYRQVGCQFSFACDGSMRRTRERGAWGRAKTIASRALSGAVMHEVGSATHFHTTSVSPGWGPRLLRVAQVGMHVFYRFGGRAGAPGAFTATPQPSDLNDLPNAPTVADLTQGLTADGKPPGLIYAANAVRDAQPVSAGNGMGGPLGSPVEPASAPAKPVADKAPEVRTSSSAVSGAAS
ncbi:MULTISPECIES: cell wall hydrolase [unclassified Caulobacter]|uniref:cell wall hydrolase n=1 Tax=unclassified Caulobacter TaxID=2648921 RepID=UPI000D36CF7D|nr:MULTISPECIES: cell wall hydrolase [unclassified Caulobacter]PTS87360.1 cell wall hydrolase [Caulobacter sp. HMWF009]PTT04753.1 cell wall hydrolase [Caulobacter sp. HMWF025]